MNGRVILERRAGKNEPAWDLSIFNDGKEAQFWHDVVIVKIAGFDHELNNREYSISCLD